MRLNFLIALLALSLLLNGFFLGGYWFAREKARKVKNSAERIGEIVRQLELTPEQKRKFRILKAEAVKTRRPYLKEMARLRSLFWKTVIKNPGDSQAMDRIIHQMAVERERYQQKIARIISEFLQGLNREQKRKFFEISNDSKVLKALLSG